VTVHERSGNFKFNATGWVLAVDGTLTIDLGSGPEQLTMDTTTCEAQDALVRYISTRPKGPKLKNDAPTGAIALPLGSTVEVRTGGTAREPEAPCTVDDGEHVHEIPIAHTAWWTFTGTGGDVTIDTAGSTFDTVVGVYVLDGGTFEQVGCVDDVFDPETGEGSLQSSITVATTAGVTYYVQIGGFGDSTGTLRFRLE
jgi:hypothetical protein